MQRRIQARPSKVGAGGSADPEAIAELEARREKHERLTRGKPARGFKDVLEGRGRGAATEPRESAEAPPEEPPPRGAKDPLLGLAPQQDASLAHRPEGRRTGRVILKG